MKKNIGSADKVIRLILGVVIVVFGFVFQTWWGLVGAVLLLTAFVGVCPIYLPFGISTAKKTKTENA